MPDREYVNDFVRRTFNLRDPKTLPRDTEIKRTPSSAPIDEHAPERLVDALRRFRRSRGMAPQRGMD